MEFTSLPPRVGHVLRTRVPWREGRSSARQQRSLLRLCQTHLQRKVVDAISLLPGFTAEHADGVKAYTQALLYNFLTSDSNHIATWIFLPDDQWPPDWHKRFNRPVVLLRVALYGHPLAGDFWDRHRTTQLRKA